jgi:hypothetical protein
MTLNSDTGCIMYVFTYLFHPSPVILSFCSKWPVIKITQVFKIGHVYINFLYDKNLGNSLQFWPQLTKHPVYYKYTKGQHLLFYHNSTDVQYWTRVYKLFLSQKHRKSSTVMSTTHKAPCMLRIYKRPTFTILSCNVNIHNWCSDDQEQKMEALSDCGSYSDMTLQYTHLPGYVHRQTQTPWP